MSLILEALRKSEAERRRGEAPNVHVELPPAPRARRTEMPAWAWIAPALAVASIAAWLLVDRAPPRGTAAIATTPAPAAAVARSPARTLPPVPRLSPPAPAVAAPAQTRAKPVDLPVRAASQQAPAATPGRTTTAVTAPILRTETDATLQLSDLSVEERKALPPLKLSMHMWNDDPARRFIILDGNRLGEGDRIGDAVITAITPDGAVLDWNGRRIKLPLR